MKETSFQNFLKDLQKLIDCYIEPTQTSKNGITYEMQIFFEKDMKRNKGKIRACKDLLKEYKKSHPTTNENTFNTQYQKFKKKL